MRNASSESSENVIEHLEAIQEGDRNAGKAIEALEKHKFFNVNQETINGVKRVRDSIQDLLADVKLMSREDIIEHDVDDRLEKLLEILKEHENEKGVEEEFLMNLSSLSPNQEALKEKLQRLFAIQMIEPKGMSEKKVQTLLMALQSNNQSFLNHLNFRELEGEEDYEKKKSLSKKMLKDIEEFDSPEEHFKKLILPGLSEDAQERYKEDSGIAAKQKTAAEAEKAEAEKAEAEKVAKEKEEAEIAEEAERGKEERETAKKAKKEKEEADRAEAEVKAKEEKKTRRKEKREVRESEKLAKEKGIGGLIYKTRKKFNDIWQGKGEKLDETTEDLLHERLKNPKLISHLDPTCSVINDMLKGLEKDELDNFLRNPNELIDISIADEALIDKLVTNKGAKDLTNLLKKLNRELEQAKDHLRLFGRKMAGKAFEKAEQKQEEIELLRSQIELTDMLINKRSNNFLYKSPRHILAMIYYFKNKNDVEAIQPDKMEKELDELVHVKREKLYAGAYKWFNRAGSTFFFKPTLESNLRALAEDENFKSLSDKPTEKLAELTKWSKGEYNDVENWVKSIGGIEKHANSTVPRLIAYLELTMRDGKTSRLTRTGRTKKLVDHLKKIQRSYIEEEVDKIETKNDQERALAFIKKLNESNRYTANLSKSILRKNALKSGAITSAVGTGLTIGATALTMGVIPAMGWLASIPAAASAGTLMGSKHIPEKHQDAAKKIAKRTLFGTAAFTTGLALPGALGLLGFGIAGATVLASPKARKWLVEHKGDIAKGAGKVAGTAAKATWLTTKYTIGLPFVITSRIIRAVVPGL